MGPRLVGQLEGSVHAKERLEVILASIAGELTVAEACTRLGVKEAMFHRLRTRVLQAGLTGLEPRPRGRPRHEMSGEQQENQQLAEENADLRQQLQLAELRNDLATILPHLVDDESSTNDVANQESHSDKSIKKTAARKKRRQRLQKRYRRK